MTTPQQPIGSGFGHDSTATNVIGGRSLAGKYAVVTGGYSGLGLATVQALVAAGAEVMVPARRVTEAREALKGFDGVEVGEMDLADIESVKRFAGEMVAKGRHVDIVIGCAGIMATPEKHVGPGWEWQFATNHLGHFVLVNGLWPLLKGGARVALTSSGAHGITDIRWDDLNFARGYEKWQAYGQSKTANVLCAVELDRLGAPHGVRAFSIDPGAILTPLQRHLTREEMMANGWVDEEGNGLDRTFKTPEQGAATQVWAVTSPQLEGMGGVYCKDCEIAVLGEGGVKPYAVDPGSAKRLWALSAEMTGVDGFGR